MYKDENSQYKVYLQNPKKSDTKYLVSNLVTNSNGEYSLTVDDFISFFSDNSNDSDISTIKKSSTDFGLGDSDISFWKDDTTYYEKRVLIYRLFGNNCNRLKLKKVVPRLLAQTLYRIYRILK